MRLVMYMWRERGGKDDCVWGSMGMRFMNAVCATTARNFSQMDDCRMMVC